MKKIKLSRRLKSLFNLVDCEGMVFYDLCCDHGHLGLEIYRSKNPKKVILNDKVSSICKNLHMSINADIPKTEIIVLNEDARHINIKSNEKKYVTISGIGGELLIEILSNLKEQITSGDKLLLSPHTKIHEVRKFLKNNYFNLIKEILVCENGKYYEMLLVNLSSNSSNISLVGKNIWLDDSKNTTTYLNEMIRYYQKKLEYNDSEEIKLIFNDLIALKTKLK